MPCAQDALSFSCFPPFASPNHPSGVGCTIPQPQTLSPSWILQCGGDQFSVLRHLVYFCNYSFKCSPSTYYRAVPGATARGDSPPLCTDSLEPAGWATVTVGARIPAREDAVEPG